jgi:hypothetical protein
VERGRKFVLGGGSCHSGPRIGTVMGPEPLDSP